MRTVQSNFRNLIIVLDVQKLSILIGIIIRNLRLKKKLNDRYKKQMKEIHCFFKPKIRLVKKMFFLQHG